jgi:hypothetical protein
MAGVGPGGTEHRGFAGEDEQAEHCLRLLRGGNRDQKITARLRLTRIFECRRRDPVPDRQLGLSRRRAEPVPHKRHAGCLSVSLRAETSLAVAELSRRESISHPTSANSPSLHDDPLAPRLWTTQ